MFRSFSLATLVGLQTAAGFACGFMAAVAGVVSCSSLFWFTVVAGALVSLVVALLRRTSADQRLYIALMCAVGFVPVAGYLTILAYAFRWGIGLLPTQDDFEGTLAAVACLLFAAPACSIALLLLREGTWPYWDHHDSQQS